MGSFAPCRAAEVGRGAPLVRVVAPVLLVLLAGVVGACGGGEGPPPATSTAALPHEVAELAILFVPSPTEDPGVQAVNAKVQSALVLAGFKLVVARSRPHDAEARLNITAAPEPTFFHVVVNGEEQVKLRVRVVLSVTDGGTIVDELPVEFVSSNGAVEDKDVAPLVVALRDSPRVKRFAQGRRVQLAQAAQRSKEADQAKYDAEEKKLERQRDEIVWVKAKPLSCRVPTALDACEGVELYLAHHPTGAHAEEGRAALAEGKPKIERLARDEAQWKSAGVEACRAHATETACDGVDVYLVKFPAGAHAEEARSITRVLGRDEAQWRAAGVEACRARATASSCDGVDLYLVKFPAGVHAEEARRLLGPR